MRSIAIAGLLVLAGTAAQAEIVCTTHRGCFETGGRIILGNGGGGVRSVQSPHGYSGFE
jgi:hypothetical protein